MFAKSVKHGGIAHRQFVLENFADIRSCYDLQEVVGTGSFGSVMKATHKTCGFICAVKVVEKTNAKALQEVRTEVDVWKVLEHPHIVKLHSIFEDRSRSYLVMEMCAGGTLFDRIVEAKQFSETEAVILSQQMIRGLFYMHSHQICHRDVKPENFLFTNRAPLKHGHLKIIDFGFACRFYPGKLLTEKIGTPFYVAPQVLDESYDERCDMWSLGCVLYLMLCGIQPFRGRNDSEVLRKVRRGQVTFQTRGWTPVSQEARRFTRKLLAMDPTVRYTAEEALTDEWIQTKTPRAQSMSMAHGFIENLLNFSTQHLLKKAALNIIAGFIREEDEKPLRDVFTSLDHNNDGTLSLYELSRGLVESKHASLDVEQLMEAVDSDGSGSIDYMEFLAAAMDRSLYLTESYCRAAFGTFDLNNDGRISSEELNAVLRITSDSKSSVKQLTPASLLRDVDLNGDNYIDFSEFMHMMQR